MQDNIKFNNLSFCYEDDEDEVIDSEQVLNHFSLNIKEGEFVALLGHNGCGKSTVAKLLNALLLPTDGKVLVFGMDTSDDKLLYDIRKNVGLVLQNPDNQIVANIVEEDVAFGPENLGIPQKELRLRVDNALKSVDMYEYKDHAPHKLSGGQKQRVAIAGIIAMEPKCIVLDEPTAMLDPKGREEVMTAIKKLNKENNITVVLITHYMDEAAQADRIVVMDDGNILTEGTPREVFSKIDLLREHKLDVPQSTKLAFLLKKAGLKIDFVPITAEECAEVIIGAIKRG